jgi:hypothetical protein
MKYFQCKLKRVVPKLVNDELINCIQIDHSWLPERYAKKNKILKIKTEDSEWENGWVVCNVYEGKDEKYVLANERNYIHQRKISDI